MFFFLLLFFDLKQAHDAITHTALSEYMSTSLPLVKLPWSKLKEVERSMSSAKPDPGAEIITP